MTDQTARYVITPPARTVLPVEGSDLLFPVSRVFCVGRNYADHALEMGHDPSREPPFFFLKSASSVTSDGRFRYPGSSSEVHHEVELVVALALGGQDIPEARALDHVWGYGIGLDMTRRDLQAEAKKLGRPWEIAKSFDGAAPCGALVPAARLAHPERGAITLDVNGTRRQSGNLDQMIWKIPEIIATLSRWFGLQAGDIIMTGTPAGVGAVERGDRLSAHIEGIGDLLVQVT